MPDFSELYADMIKRHKGPKPHKAWVNDTFNSLPQGEHGNEYIPVRLDPRRFADFVQPPLTFSRVSSYITHNLETAVSHARRGHKYLPNRDLVGSDFADFGDRKLLAELGYFSIDLPKKRAAVDRQRQIDAYLDQAYDVLHLDRTAVHKMIAAKLEATRFDGIWARSTGEYSEACRKVDMTVLARSPAIAQSIQELGQ